MSHHANKFKKVNERFAYSDLCLESYPCQHYIVLDGQQDSMDGVAIYALCVKNNWPVPEHFASYKAQYLEQQKWQKLNRS